jgi:hypothetical protein
MVTGNRHPRTNTGRPIVTNRARSLEIAEGVTTTRNRTVIHAVVALFHPAHGAVTAGAVTAGITGAGTFAGSSVVAIRTDRLEMTGGGAAALRRAVIGPVIAVFSGIRHSVAAMVIANVAGSGA